MVFQRSILKLTFLHSLGIFRHLQRIYHALYLTIHKSGQVIDRISYTMVSNTPLWIIVGTNLRRAVTCANHRLTARSNIVNILLVFLVVYLRTQT